MDDTRAYAFTWDLLGDLQVGRPNLGPLTSVEAYRLMQFTFRDVLESRYGEAESDEIFREAGRIAGEHFAQHHIGDQPDLAHFVSVLQQALLDSGVGVLRVEAADPDKGYFQLTVSEDLDCSGLPELGHGVCAYDEGFIAALLEHHTGQSYDVEEVDCWCTGDRTCRFEARSTQ